MRSRLGRLEKRAAGMERRELEKLLKGLVDVATDEELRRLADGEGAADVFGDTPEAVAKARGGDGPMKVILEIVDPNDEEGSSA